MTETKNSPQEIDLMELFSKLGKWIGKITHTIFYGILYFFLRNALKFSLVIILGGIITIIIHNRGEKYYKCELIGYSHTISNIEVIQFVNNWNFVASFDEYSEKMIKDIKATYLLDLNKDGKWDMVEESDEDIVTDTAIINHRLYGNFCLQLKVYDTTIIDKLSQNLFDYMAKNKRVKSMNEIRLRQQKELIPKIQKELSDLDSLKKEQYFQKKKMENDKTGSLMIWNEQETKLLHSDILSLYRQKQDIERELYLYPEPFEVIQDFTVPREAENSLINLLIFWEALSLSFGFLVILLYDQRRKINELLNRSKEIKD